MRYPSSLISCSHCRPNGGFSPGWESWGDEPRKWDASTRRIGLAGLRGRTLDDARHAGICKNSRTLTRLSRNRSTRGAVGCRTLAVDGAGPRAPRRARADQRQQRHRASLNIHIAYVYYRSIRGIFLTEGFQATIRLPKAPAPSKGLELAGQSALVHRRPQQLPFTAIAKPVGKGTRDALDASRQTAPPMKQLQRRAELPANDGRL
jgi:hypothetical protein